jgi:DNA polymerase I
VDQLNLYKDAHPIVPLMLEWRGYATIKSTFADALPKKADSNSRIHTTLSPTTARTGRFASDSPNLQNIPARSEMGRRVRACFIPDPGWKLCAADLSQIEMRWMAHESQEPVMVNGYQDPDWDIHTQTAMDIFGLEREQVDPLEHRLPSKTVGFGTIYLIGAEGLQGQILDITGTSVASEPLPASARRLL